MQFNIPTTKAEMFDVLNQLFHFYRVQRVEFEEIPLEELTLERLIYEPSTDNELEQKAQTLLASKLDREVAEQTSKMLAEIASLRLNITAVQESATNRIAEVNALYDDSEEKVRKQAENNGLFNSSVYVDKLAYLENQRNLKISEITSERDLKVSQLNSELTTLSEKLSEIEDNCASISQKDVDAKVVELRAEEEDVVREVFKYNNGLDEKEQRYKNTIIQANANLKLKYKEISVGELSKDQLVEMGYYEDVIDCVCGYYDNLDALTAYRDIIAETKLMIYLDDYYENVIYMYGVRSGAIG